MNRLPREPEAFGEAIVREMLRMQPERNIEFSGPLDVVADGHHLDLSHLYRMVWQQPKQGQHIVTQYLDRLEAMRAAESTRTAPVVEQRHGWTIAAALIWYKQRQRAAPACDL